MSYEIVPTTVTVDVALDIIMRDSQEVIEVIESSPKEISVSGPDVVDSELMQQTFNEIETITQHQTGGVPHSWVFRMVYDGRCWYMEPDGEGYHIGYYDIASVEGWRAIVGV